MNFIAQNDNFKFSEIFAIVNPIVNFKVLALAKIKSFKLNFFSLSQHQFYIDTAKNPAYGRQSNSRPMWIVAPMPKEGGPRIPKNQIFLKTEKLIQNAKTQKCLEICQN